jgi:hypothetical protein
MRGPTSLRQDKFLLDRNGIHQIVSYAEKRIATKDEAMLTPITS